MIRNPAPLWVATVLALIGGLLLRTAFPAPDIWPFAFLGVVLVLLALRGRGFWSGFLIGAIAGGALWGSLIFWLTLYLGPVPWLALCALMTIWVGISGGLIALIYSWSESRQSPWIWWLGAPATIAAVWSARETLAASWPYGGFSWARLAYSQASSPFGDLVGYIGVGGLSFVVALISAVAVAILVRPGRAVMIGWGILVLAALLVPTMSSNSVGSMRVLVAQGNSNAGLFAKHEPGDILSDHVSATMAARDDADAHDIDAVVWPENASDIDPLRSSLAADTLSAVSDAFGAPVVTGTITNPREGVYFNSSVVWIGTSGAIAQYDKMRPVPFAEYMPNRAFFRSLVPDLVDLVGRDYAFGTRPNVVDISGVPVGLSICFDITDNTLTTQMVSDGAQVIFAQTNNADFGTTDENLQQLAIARLAAMETGRALVNASTVGTTAIIDADGHTQAQLEPYQPGYLIADVPLYSTVTPAVIVGRTIELLLCGLAAAGILTIGFVSRRGRANPRGLRDPLRDVVEDTPDVR